MSIKVDKNDFREFNREMNRLKREFTRDPVNKIMRRHARPIVNEMKQNSPSTRLQRTNVIGTTTKQTGNRRAPGVGIRIGIVKNGSKDDFPDFTAPALASVLEYGTEERFRTLVAGGVVTGRQSTGSISGAPWIRPAWDRNRAAFILKTIESMRRKVR